MNVHILSHCEDAPASLHTLKDDMRAVFLQCMQERDMQCGNITQAMIQVAVNEIVTLLVQRMDDLVQARQSERMAEAHGSYGMLGLIGLPSSTIQLPASLIVRFAWISYVSSDFVERIC